MVNEGRRMTICTYADNLQRQSPQRNTSYCTAGFGIGMPPDRSGSCLVKSCRLGASAGALTRLRRLPVIRRSSASSATAHAPGVGGIQLYGGPYGCVRAGLGLGSAALSFSLRGQSLSVMRNFGEAEGVDITRRCWDCSELSDKRDDTGLGEFVRREEVIESGDGRMFDVKEAGEGRVRGGGRRLLRLARSAPRIRTSIVLVFFRNPNLPL
jgi:hypothetical protein